LRAIAARASARDDGAREGEAGDVLASSSPPVRSPSIVEASIARPGRAIVRGPRGA
jgi:hypothetical protein